ncbi:MAG: hybrid sensor histidine kinase/response regulator [Candidatus Krumholzibacteria bacterium]|nr:hybrid sensor histidine kinase/response regulator [Candidatus Krumholzibacteria bacterium]
MENELQIIVIDDDPADIVLIQRFLDEIEVWEYDLIAHNDATSGIAELAVRHPDVVILDHMLGSDMGLEVIDRIRDVGYAGPLIFLTGRGDEEIAVQAWKAGVDDYIPKRSVSANSLKRSISHAIEKHKLREAIEKQRKKLQETNESLVRKSEEVRTFYHAVSHELKTPLTSAREFMSILLDEIAGPIAEQQRQYLETARESLDQMTYYIDDLLDSTRLETGKLTIDPKPTSLTDVIGHVIRMLKRRADAKGLSLATHVQPELPAVRADRRRITQVVSNLVGNAIKFTAQGDEVNVRAIQDPAAPDYVRVSVEDTGCGIAEEHRERVFDRLYQVDRSESPSQGGLGLGLNICRGIVELHGGEITVDSTEGKGSTFTFTVPVQQVSELVAHQSGEES